MIRTLLWGFGAAAWAVVSGCDPSYYIHLSTHVSDSDGPVEGATVVSLSQHPDTQWVRTNSAGHVVARFGGFLEARQYEPVAVFEDSHRLFVGFPGRDYVLDPEGLFGRTRWDSELEVSLEARPVDAGIVPDCDVGGACSLVLPSPHNGFCHLVLVVFSEQGADVSHPEVERVDTGNGASNLSFQVERVEDTHQVAIDLCRSSPLEGAQSSWAIVTDRL